MKTTKQIEQEVKKNYILEKYKAFLEQIVDLELSIESLKTEEGQKYLTDQIGEANIASKIQEAENALTLKKSEAKFLKDKIDGKEKA